jgi:NADPH:quinone reductase-like Zn-dependent oxidoreductase
MILNHRTDNIVQAIQNAHGVNLVIELVSTTLQTSIEASAQDGRIVLIGNLGGQQATIDTQVARLKRVNIIGGGHLRTSTANEQRILQLIADKAIDPLIARVLPIEQAAEAHQLLESGELMGKIVLVHT